MDFLTIAVPLCISCFEVQEIIQFIYGSDIEVDLSPVEHRQRRCRMGLLAFVTTCAGVAIGSVVAHKAYVEGCPEGRNTDK